MAEASRRPLILRSLGVLALLAWAAVDLAPAWWPSELRRVEAERRRDARQAYEQRYNAGWLTAWYRAHGSLPDPMPPNLAAAGNGVVVQRCPQQREDLVSDVADWALCSEDRAVRAMARHPDRVLGLEVPERQRLFPE